METFREAFIRDCVEIFSKNVDDVHKLWAVLLNTHHEDSEILSAVKQRPCGLINHFTIPVHIPNKVKSGLLSSFQYHVFVAGLYMRYINKFEPTEAQCNLNQIPFNRVVVDVDVKPGAVFTYRELVDLCINKLSGLFKKKVEISITKRRGSSLNFHMVCDVQVDSASYLAIVDKLRTQVEQAISPNRHVIIDRPNNWTLPGGRGHYLELAGTRDEQNLQNAENSQNTAYNMSWCDFKKISIVDVWRFNFNTILKPVFCKGEMFPPSETLLTFSTAEQIKTDFTAAGDVFVLENFFAKFIDYTKTVVTFCATDFTVSFDNLLNGWAYGTGESRGGKRGDSFSLSDLSAHETEEFFDCFYDSEIIFNRPLDKFMEIEFANNSTDISQLHEYMHILNIPSTDQMDQRTRAIKFIKGCGTPKLTLSILSAKEAISKQAIQNYPWQDYVKIFLIQIEEKYFVYYMIYLYFIYCKNNSVTPRANFLFLSNVLQEYEHVFGFNPFLENNQNDLFDCNLDFDPAYTPGQCPDALFSAPETVTIFKHILEVMINSGCITSVCSMMLRSNIFDNLYSPLACVVLLLNTLDIDDQARVTLVSYISGHMESYDVSLSKAMSHCYTKNDILYFLTGLYNQTLCQANSTFFNLFPGITQTGPPPGKKRKKNEELSKDRLQVLQCFTKYIAFAKSNKCFTYVYDSNHYIEMSGDSGYIDKASIEAVSLEPMHSAYWYRRDAGIYFSITQQHELHTPSLYTLLYIETAPQIKQYGLEIFNTNNFDLKSQILDCLLKMNHFLRHCDNNKFLFILLAPVLDVDVDPLKIDYITDAIKIIDFDLNTKGDLPDFRSVCKNYPLVYEAISYLHAVICTMSLRCKIDLNNPAAFIEQCGINYLQRDNIPQQSAELFPTSGYDIKSNTEDQYSLFMKHLIEAARKFDQMDATEDVSDGDTLTTITLGETQFKSDNSEPINEFIARRHFNGCRDVDMSIDVEGIPKELMKFIVLILSWLIRFEVSHSLDDTSFFKFIEDKRCELYDEFRDMVLKKTGPVMINEEMSNLKEYFKAFCENTSVELSDNFKDLLPPGYFLNPKYDGPYKDDVYYGVVGLMTWGEFTIDTCVDIFRNLCAYTHRGNYKRKCLSFLKRTGTGKNVMIEKILSTLFPTEWRQNFSNDDLQNCNKDAGNILSKPCSANLLVWFDEVTDLKNIKVIANHGTLSEREFNQKSYAEYRIASHVVISTNQDPKSEDAASSLRLLPIDRTMQYVQLIKTHRFKRDNCVADSTLSFINDRFGVQLLLNRLPTGGETENDILGLFLIFWSCSDLVFYKFRSPTSNKNSPLMKKRIAEFLYKSQPANYLLDNHMIRFTATKSISLHEFDSKVTTLFTNCRSVFGPNFKISDSLSELKDLLANYISNGRIYVEV